MHKKTNQTAAIYDRWLYTLGGGEQVAFAYAECLRELGFTTSILTHKQVDRELAERKMGVQLSDIELRYLPESSSVELSQYSEEYDVFINTSYLDYFANRSKFGILSVFFPGQIFLTPLEYFKRAFVIPSFRSFFIYPSRFEGFRFDEYLGGKIYKWLGPQSTIILNSHVSKLSLTFYLETITFSLIDSLSFEVKGVGRVFPIERKLQLSNTVTFDFDLQGLQKPELTITLPNLPYANRIALVRLTIPHWRYSLYDLFKHYFPKWEMRLHGGPGVTKRSDLESYDKIVTISNFCQYWIRRYWGLNSSVLYPPVNTDHFSVAARKKKHIIHIGRFFVTGHCKKQLDLVKVFKRMYDSHDINEWELHFIGSIHEGKQHREYYEQAKFEAQGYPIHFHTNCNFKELCKRLSEAAIYWHATGLDENPERNPILLEHFGITTVEAMASGCVPVVINAGGQKEIVTPGSGFLWNTRQELIDQTISIIQDPEKMQTLSKAAKKRSNDFDRAHFKEGFRQLIKNSSTSGLSTLEK